MTKLNLTSLYSMVAGSMDRYGDAPETDEEFCDAIITAASYAVRHIGVGHLPIDKLPLSGTLGLIFFGAATIVRRDKKANLKMYGTPDLVSYTPNGSLATPSGVTNAIYSIILTAARSQIEKEDRADKMIDVMLMLADACVDYKIDLEEAVILAVESSIGE